MLITFDQYHNIAYLLLAMHKNSLINKLKFIMNKIMLVLFILFTKSALAQENSYDKFIRIADSLKQVKSYELAATSFSKAFRANNWRGTIEHRYNAACAWSLAGLPDSAFYHLYRIANSGNYVNYEKLIKEPDLFSLHIDKRWTPLIKAIDENQLKAEPKLDRKLALILDSIRTNDRKYRIKLTKNQRASGFMSKDQEPLLKQMKYNDSINLAVVTSIINRRGWLGKDKIGLEGNNTLFLVIQHSNLPTMLKYLPVMRDAVKKGNADASSLAMLEDRVNMLQNKKQIYGSQITTDRKTGKYILWALEDPDHVDERRARIGLGSIADYVKQFGFTWNPSDYK
jgi:hypothetical protein